MVRILGSTSPQHEPRIVPAGRGISVRPFGNSKYVVSDHEVARALLTAISLVSLFILRKCGTVSGSCGPIANRCSHSLPREFLNTGRRYVFRRSHKRRTLRRWLSNSRKRLLRIINNRCVPHPCLLPLNSRIQTGKAHAAICELPSDFHLPYALRRIRLGDLENRSIRGRQSRRGTLIVFDVAVLESFGVPAKESIVWCGRMKS